MQSKGRKDQFTAKTYGNGDSQEQEGVPTFCLLACVVQFIHVMKCPVWIADQQPIADYYVICISGYGIS